MTPSELILVAVGSDVSDRLSGRPREPWVTVARGVDVPDLERALGQPGTAKPSL